MVDHDSGHRDEGDGDAWQGGDPDVVRAAALQLIAAGRSLLDAAEAALDDPVLADRIGGVITLIGERLGATGTPRSQPDDDRPRSTDEGP